MDNPKIVSTPKPRTAREQAVDAWSKANATSKSSSGQYETALERQYGQIASSEKKSGTEQLMIGRKNQAQ